MIITNEKTSYCTAKKRSNNHFYFSNERVDCGISEGIVVKIRGNFYTRNCSVSVHKNVTLQGLNTMKYMSRIFIALKNLWHLNIASKIFFSRVHYIFLLSHEHIPMVSSANSVYQSSQEVKFMVELKKLDQC